MSDNGKEHLEISTDRRRRWVGWIGFLLLFIAVSGALIAVFYYFTHKWLLPVVLVGFIVTYMSLMGWLAMRRFEDKDM